MSTTVQKVSKSNRAVKAIIAATFPQYKGRKITVRMTDSSPSALATGWQEGSKTDVRIYNTATGGVTYCHEEGRIDLTGMSQHVLVEQSIFCGKDCGITISFLRPTGADDFSVMVDSVLAVGMLDTWNVVIESTPGMEWGSYDRGHERATKRDLLVAAVEGRVADLQKGERKAVAA